MDEQLMWLILALLALGLQCAVLHFIIRSAVLMALKQHDKTRDTRAAAHSAAPWPG